MGLLDIFSSFGKKDNGIRAGMQYRNEQTESISQKLLPAIRDSGRKIYFEETNDSYFNIDIKLDGVNEPIGIVKRNRQNGSVSHIQIFTGTAAPVQAFPADIYINGLLEKLVGTYLTNVPNPYSTEKK